MTDTISAVLRKLQASTNPKGFVFVNSASEESAYSFAELAMAAELRGRQLLSSGCQPRDRIALLLQDNEEFVLSFLGCIAANLIPVPIYPPPRMGKKTRQLEAAANIVSRCRAHATLTDEKLAELLINFDPAQSRFTRIITVSSLATLEPDQRELALPAAGDCCFLQFTSGSTAEPKGVVVTHKNLLANCEAIIIHGLKANRERDRGLSWLPLFHDMGLIGFVIAPLFGQIPVVLFPTMSFVRRPGMWMSAIDKYRATISFGPNFAFALATKRAARSIDEGIDLSCLRVLGCGAEPISPRILREFTSAFAPAKLQASAITASYGMAEASLALSFAPLGEGLRTVWINAKSYREHTRVELCLGGEEEAQELVSCGKIIKGHQILILSEEGEELGENQIGEIVVSGPSISDKYFESPGASEAVFRNGRLHSQDLGFINEERLYVCGRKKDLLILNGRNFHPQDLEWAIEKHEGLKQGSVVCFSLAADSTEHLIVVAETANPENPELVELIRRTLSREFGLKTKAVNLVRPGQVPRTSSGKRQRQRTRALYQAAQLD